MNIVLRSENKYLLNTETYWQRLHYVKQIFHADSHNQEEGYLVRSLYFDTLDDRDFCEKEAGVEIRRKIRLRVYEIVLTKENTQSMTRELSGEKNFKIDERRCFKTN